MRSDRKGSKSTLPPQVKGLPLLGNLLDLRRDVAGLLVSAYQEHGPMFRINRLGKNIVVLAGVAANEFFARHEQEHFYSKDVYHQMSVEMGSDHHFTALDGPAHHHLRKQLSAGFSRQVLAGSVPGMIDCVKDTARSWQPGQKLDVMKTVADLLLRQAGISLLSHSPRPEDLDEIHRFCKTFVGVGVDIQPPVFARLPAYRRAKRHFFRMFGGILKNHRKSRDAGDRGSVDLVDVALEAEYENGSKLTDTDVTGCSFYPYVMNSVYTSRTCSYLLYELLRDPTLMARVVSEVDAVFAGPEPSLTALQRMSVFRSAIKEALRLYPLVVGVPRHVAKDFEFEGYEIRKGQKVLFAASVTHFLPEFFPAPDRFDVDRFLPPRNEHLQPRVMAPFGLGSHHCLGANITEVLTLTTLGALLSTVRFRTDPPDYRARRVADPLPGPRGFEVRVVEKRPEKPPEVAPGTLVDKELALLLASQETSREVLVRMMNSVQVQTYGPGETILRQGEDADSFYILVEGSVDILQETPEGRTKPVGRLSAGEFFGEVGLLQRVKRTATVRAGSRETVKVMVLDRDTFMELVTESDLVADEIAAVVRRRDLSLNLAAVMPNLSEERVGGMHPRFQIRRYSAGDMIIRQGDPSDRFYILMQGKVEVVNQHPDGRRLHVAWLEPGEHFGEIGLLGNRNRTATVLASESDTEVIAIEREAFQEVVGESQETESALARNMASRLIGLARQQTDSH